MDNLRGSIDLLAKYWSPGNVTSSIRMARPKARGGGARKCRLRENIGDGGGAGRLVSPARAGSGTARLKAPRHVADANFRSFAPAGRPFLHVGGAGAIGMLRLRGGVRRRCAQHDGSSFGHLRRG